MTDTIFISQLRLEAILGVYPEERKQSQSVVLDIELETRMEAAIKSDDISDTIDYANLISQLKIWIAERPFHLIETLAHHLADKILQTTRAQNVRLRASKFPPELPAASVGVVVFRDADRVMNN
jgi:dihydroneopterin aldolase